MSFSLKILGSAAAEGIPAVFCGCETCRKARKNGGKDLRFRTSYILNERVRVDYGPDAIAQDFKFQLNSELIRHIFITHPHLDHFTPELFLFRRWDSMVPEGNTLSVYGSRGTIAKMMECFWGTTWFDGDLKGFQLETVIFEYFKTIYPAGEDMEVIPLPASHYFDCPYIEPAIYVIRSGDKWIFLANDTGAFPAETWKFLEEKKFKFDIVVCDCTWGTRTNDSGHLGGECILDVKKRLEKIGSVTTDTKFAVNHFTHNCHATHAELEEYFNPHGILVGYDGMEL